MASRTRSRALRSSRTAASNSARRSESLVATASGLEAPSAVLTATNAPDVDLEVASTLAMPALKLASSWHRKVLKPADRHLDLREVLPHAVVQTSKFPGNVLSERLKFGPELLKTGLER